MIYTTTTTLSRGNSFEDVDAMALFRACLSGEKLGPHWMDSSSDSYVRGLDNWSLGWVQGEPEWKVKTPGLRSFTYDLRKRGKMTRGYWERVEVREQLLTVCETQGIRGEVLWDG
jgi:hypothetical protein